MNTDRLLKFFQNLVLLQVVCIMCIALIEFVFRFIDYDFEAKRKAFDQTPVFYQYPIYPDGSVYYRRQGPTVWKGKVLAPMLKQVSGSDDAYKDEKPVTISYDNNGFRNPLNLTDWDIVFVGDSFTELGYLPYEDLFSTQVGNLLKLTTKNLGVSYTGPLTHCHYLKKYGKSKKTHHAILVFYEGNDLLDLIEEEGRLVKSAFNIPLENRNIEQLPKQTSFIRAFINLISMQHSSTVNLCDANFISNHGLIPVTLKTMPPHSKNLDPGSILLLKSALTQWAEISRQMGIKPWLAFMPTNIRVLYGYLSINKSTNPQLAAWQPTDLPSLVEKLCKETGITFIDLTPDLHKKSQKGVLTYNTLYDNHLNVEGSRVVAKTIADALSSE